MAAPGTSARRSATRPGRAAARRRRTAPTGAARSSGPVNGPRHLHRQPATDREKATEHGRIMHARAGRAPVPSVDGALSHDHRAVPDQERRADPDDDGGRARGPSARGGLQPLQSPRRRRAHRPAHRFGHRRDERGAVGGHPARRRVVRRIAFVVPLPRGRDRAVSVPPRHPDAPGPRGREDPLQRHRPARARSSRRTPTSTRPARTSSSPAPRRSTWSSPRDDRRRRSTRSRATWTPMRSTR